MNNNNALVNFIGSIIALDNLAEIRVACFNALQNIISTVCMRSINTINGLSHNLTQTDYDNLQRHWDNGDKILSIKTLRILTGWGLLETKKAMENPDNFKQDKTEPW